MINNAYWATSLISTLYHSGICHFCIAPGSRSAPLALALFEAKSSLGDIRLHTHFDERGLAFFALGLSKVSHSPVAIITTSGTAVANLHPAVIEAYETNSPLVILAADRPDALINCGANQAIQQKNIFGDNVQFSTCLISPKNEDELHAQQQSLRTALQTHGLDMARQGPLHINCQFDEPLYDRPSLDYEKIFSAYKAVNSQTPEHPKRLNADLSRLQTSLEQTSLKLSKGLIILGALTPAQQVALSPWLAQVNCPIVADINSQFRLSHLNNLIGYADLLLLNQESDLFDCDYIVQFGARLVSKRLNQYLQRFTGQYFLILESEKSLDPTRKAQTIVTPYHHICEALVPSSITHLGLEIFRRQNQIIEKKITQAFETPWNEAAICIDLVNALVENTALFAGNSLAIRMLDSFSPMSPHSIHVYSNRGASGIDGLIASSIALAHGQYEQVVLVIGDTAFLHDLNSLSLIQKSPIPIKILILNNNGGGIFGLLPAAKEAAFESLFLMPHNLQFEHIAQQFNVLYQQVSSRGALQDSVQSFCACPQSHILECTIPKQSTAFIPQFHKHFLDHDSN